MGKESPCWLRLNGQVFTGKARLDHDRLTFDGERHVTIPLKEIRSLGVDDGVLIVEHGATAAKAEFEIGVQAERWAKAIREPRSLLDKLGIKSGQRTSIIGTPEIGFSDLLRDRAEVHEGKPAPASDAIFYFVAHARDLTRMRGLAASLTPAGALWVVRPKGRRDVTEAHVSAAGKAAGLADVKVVSFSDASTADKFVVRSIKRAPRAAVLARPRIAAVRRRASR